MCVLQACAEMLQENTSLQSLNIESNFITSDGMMAIIKAMANNATLVELKIDNQVGWIAYRPHRYQLITAVNNDVIVLLSATEAEAGRFSWDGNRLHVGEQLQHPQVRLPLHPAGAACQSRHGHHTKQRHEWETLGKSFSMCKDAQMNCFIILSFLLLAVRQQRLRWKQHRAKQKKNQFWPSRPPKTSQPQPGASFLNVVHQSWIQSWSACIH